MPVSFYTIATRVMHFGWYGGGSDDQRLFPLFLGYPDLVRGYDVGTLQAADCLPAAASGCPALDRPMGSRVLVANLEFRFRLLRPFGASLSLPALPALPDPRGLDLDPSRQQEYPSIRLYG